MYLKNCTRGCLALLVSFAATMGTLPTKAGVIPPASTVEIAQAADAAANETLQMKATQVIELLVEEKYAAARESVSLELAEKLSAEQIEQIWGNLIAATGPVKKITGTKVINTINANLVVVTAEFEKEKDDFIVIFDAQGEIVGIDFPKIDPIDRIAEIFVNALANNDYPRARGYLHPFLKIEIFPQQISTRWEELQRKMGRVKRVGKPQVSEGSSVVLVPVEFEKTTQNLFLIFDDDGRITGVDIPQP